MPTLAAASSSRLGKTRPATNRDTVKPIPARAPAPTMCVQRVPVGSGARPHADRDPSERGDAHHHADHQSDHNTDRHGSRSGDVHFGIGVEADTGIGEREERHVTVGPPQPAGRGPRRSLEVVAKECLLDARATGALGRHPCEADVAGRAISASIRDGEAWMQPAEARHPPKSSRLWDC